MRLVDALAASDGRHAGRLCRPDDPESGDLVVERVDSAESRADGAGWEMANGRGPLWRATLVELVWLLNELPGLDQDGWQPMPSNQNNERDERVNERTVSDDPRSAVAG